MNTTTNGTDPGPIAWYLNNVAKIRAVYVHGAKNVSLSMIEAAIDRGEPPIVDFQAWRTSDRTPWHSDWADGHFNVVVGYDSKNLFFMDPSTNHRYAYVPKIEFIERWHDVEGEENVHRWRMLILVAAQKSSHPVKPLHNYATFED